MADDYASRPVVEYECPDCGKRHSNKTRNRVCSKCQAGRRKHPCPDCGTTCDHRAERCNLCAIQIHVRLHVRGEPTYHKPSGYWLVKVPIDDPMAPMRNGQGYVRQHRLAMADFIGRPLEPDEHVHHLNHNRGDNRIENLQLLGRLDHMAMHAAERAARTHCKWGHEYTPENTYVVPKTGNRQCRKCSALRAKGEHPSQN